MASPVLAAAGMFMEACGAELYWNPSLNFMMAPATIGLGPVERWSDW